MSVLSAAHLFCHRVHRIAKRGSIAVRYFEAFLPGIYVPKKTAECFVIQHTFAVTSVFLDVPEGVSVVYNTEALDGSILDCDDRKHIPTKQTGRAYPKGQIPKTCAQLHSTLPNLNSN